VAGTVTSEELRQLAAFRAENGCAISVFVDLDPSLAPTPPDVETRVNSLLDRADKEVEERKDSLARDQREALKADLQRMRGWFDDGFDRQGAQGVAVFAAGLDGFWSTLTTADPVEDAVKIGNELYLAPLARLADRADSALVAVVGRERGEVFRLRGGRLVVIADESEEVPGQHDQGGWSQARYERHIDEIVAQHWKRVAEILDRCVRRLHGVRVVLIGAEGMRSDFENVLSNEVKGCLAGWANAEAHADATALLEAAKPVLNEWWAGREGEILERWREESGRNGRAVNGWQETLEAVSDGRVEVLLVQDGADERAYQCPQCGRVQSTNGSCPLDGAPMESRDGGFDLALHQTLAHGGSVHVIRDRQDLAPVGGVAALLRF
jgi:peptide chain release factor subunit 1